MAGVIRFKSRGSFKNTERFLAFIAKWQLERKLAAHAQRGVSALASATPTDTGATASSWNYDIEVVGRGCRITWTNSNVNAGFPIAIMLQYGHGTGTGGYVQGRDYINPAMQPIFDQIADDVWNEVTSA